MSGGQMEVLFLMKLKLEGLDISVWDQVQVHFEKRMEFNLKRRNMPFTRDVEIKSQE